MSCPQCFSGHVNPGTPVGKFETVHGLRTYVSRPPKEQQAKGVIVIISDAFGVDFVNNQILADHYASAGQYIAYLPDFMDGKPAPISMMYNMAYLADGNTSWLMYPYYLISSAASLIPHLIRNRFSKAWPRVTAFFGALKKETNLPIAAAGFCWGGLHAIYLTHDRDDVKDSKSGEHFLNCAFAAHPSAVSMPDDIDKVKLPLSIAVGDDDAVVSRKDAENMKDILQKKTDVKCEAVIYPGAKHGFSIRASRIAPDSQETKQAEEAENQALAWYKQHFTSS